MVLEREMTKRPEEKWGDQGFKGTDGARHGEIPSVSGTIGPTSVDAFFMGERQNKESFTAYVARKKYELLYFV